MGKLCAVITKQQIRELGWEYVNTTEMTGSVSYDQYRGLVDDRGDVRMYHSPQTGWTILESVKAGNRFNGRLKSIDDLKQVMAWTQIRIPIKLKPLIP